MSGVEESEPEIDRPRTLEEIVEQLGFVETPGMQDIRSRIIEAGLRELTEDVVSLSASYREAGMEIVDANRDRYEMLGLALELSMARIWRDVDDQRFLESVESAMDLAYAYQFFGVEEDLTALMDATAAEKRNREHPPTSEG